MLIAILKFSWNIITLQILNCSSQLWQTRCKYKNLFEEKKRNKKVVTFSCMYALLGFNSVHSMHPWFRRLWRTCPKSSSNWRSHWRTCPKSSSHWRRPPPYLFSQSYSLWSCYSQISAQIFLSTLTFVTFFYGGVFPMWFFPSFTIYREFFVCMGT